MVGSVSWVLELQGQEGRSDELRRTERPVRETPVTGAHRRAHRDGTYGYRIASDSRSLCGSGLAGWGGGDAGRHAHVGAAAVTRGGPRHARPHRSVAGAAR
jgi:hypothetical protein